jgi:hypothetical protein
MLYSVLTNVFYGGSGSEKFILDMTSEKLPDQLFMSSYIPINICVHSSH